MDQVVELEAKVDALETSLASLRSENNRLKQELQHATFQTEMIKLLSPTTTAPDSKKRLGSVPDKLLDSRPIAEKPPKASSRTPRPGVTRATSNIEHTAAASITAGHIIQSSSTEAMWALIQSYLRRQQGDFVEAVCTKLKDMLHDRCREATSVEDEVKSAFEETTSAVGVGDE